MRLLICTHCSVQVEVPHMHRNMYKNSVFHVSCFITTCMYCAASTTTTATTVFFCPARTDLFAPLKPNINVDQAILDCLARSRGGTGPLRCSPCINLMQRALELRTTGCFGIPRSQASVQSEENHTHTHLLEASVKRARTA